MLFRSEVWADDEFLVWRKRDDMASMMLLWFGDAWPRLESSEREVIGFPTFISMEDKAVRAAGDVVSR